MKTRVVNINREKADVYIGRGSRHFGNPFVPRETKTAFSSTVPVADKSEAIARYQHWLTTDEQLPGWIKPTPAELQRLKGRSLGCYCRPKRGFQGQLLCHGQILVALLEGIAPEEVE